MSALDVFCLAIAAGVFVTLAADMVRAHQLLRRIRRDEPFADARDITGRVDD